MNKPNKLPVMLERAVSLLLIAVILSIIFYIARTVLPDTAITTDEHSYLMQSHQFVSGHLKYPYPGDHLRRYVCHRLSMVICDPVHGWFSRYPPGHALWLVPGVIMNATFVMPLLAALISLGFLSATARRLGISRLLILYLFAMCPFFLFIHATLLSHTTAFAAACAMLYGYVRWVDERKNGWAVFSGLSWSYLYLTRPFTAFMIGLFFGIHAMVRLIFNRRDGAVWLGVILFAASAGFGIFLNMVYNYIMLGDPFTPPYLFYKPDETLGFGPDSMGHSVEMARRQLFDNLLLWDHWVWGLPHGSLLFFLALVIIGWRMAWTPMFLAVSISFWIGYFFFHYPGPHEIGPGYYFESLPFAMLAAAMGLQRMLDPGIKKPVRFFAALGFLLVLPVYMIPFSRAQIHSLREEFSERTALFELINSTPPDSLIIFDNIEVDTKHYDNDSMLMYYPDGLASDPLVLPNYNDASDMLGRMFSRKHMYSLHSESMNTLELVPWVVSGRLDREIEFDRLHSEPALTIDRANGDFYRVVPRGDHPATGYMAFGSYILVVPGRYEVKFELSVAGSDDAAPDTVWATLDVALSKGAEVAWSRDVSTTGDVVERGEFSITENTMIEPRVMYHGRGVVSLRSIHVRELQDN